MRILLFLFYRLVWEVTIYMLNVALRRPRLRSTITFLFSPFVNWSFRGMRRQGWHPDHTYNC